MILNKLFIDEFKKGAKLLAKWLLNVIQAKKKALIGELKPKGKLQKNPIKMSIETLIKPGNINEKKVTISITKTISKIYEPGLYNEVINDLVYSRC